MELRKCPRCGEMYSVSYRRCPFCEELDRPRRGGRRKADKGYTPGVRGPLLGILLLVLALLVFYFFGGELKNRFADEPSLPLEEVEKPIEQEPSETDPPVVDPFVGDPSEVEPPEDEPVPPVIEEPVPPELSAAELNRTDFTMSVGETFQMVISPEVEGVVWKSRNSTVASVSETGLVTGITAGNTTVTATKGEASLECIVRVTGGSSGGSTASTDVSNAKLSSTDFTLNVGESTRLRVSGTEVSATWSIGNSSVASISSNGTVKALKSGITTAYAKVGSKTLECIVRVR